MFRFFSFSKILATIAVISFSLSLVSYNVNVNAESSDIKLANDTTAPTVSIGSGNVAQQNMPAEGATVPLPNTPTNTNGPFHENTVSGVLPVYGTAYDPSGIYEIHLRFIKENTLVAPEQSTSCPIYRNPTGVYNCGIFAYTQGKPTAFVEGLNGQQLLANVDTNQITQTQGNGWYWIILGAQDIPGNYSNTDLEYWHRDPRIRVYINNTTLSIDDNYTSPIQPGYACGIGSALQNDGLRLTVNNFESNYSIQARYRVGGNPTFTSWSTLSNGYLGGSLTLPAVYPGVAMFEAANTGNTQAGEAAWEVRVIDNSDNTILATDSIIYTIVTDPQSNICGYVPTVDTVDLQTAINPAQASGYLGDNVTFNITTSNASIFDVANVSNTVCLPNQLQFVSATAPYQATTINGKSCGIFSFNPLAANSSQGISVTARIIQNTVPSVTITSVATFNDSTKNETLLTNNTSSSVVTVLSNASSKVPDLVRTGGAGVGK